jgi:hypothetical protein
VDNGIHRLSGTTRRGEGTAPSFGRSPFSVHWSRPAPANDNAAPLAWRLRRWAARIVLAAVLLAAIWDMWA